jgi:hypothetical protein
MNENDFIITILCDIPDVFLLFLSHISKVCKHNKTRENTGDAVNRCSDETIPAKTNKRFSKKKLNCASEVN